MKYPRLIPSLDKALPFVSQISSEIFPIYFQPASEPRGLDFKEEALAVLRGIVWTPTPSRSPTIRAPYRERRPRRHTGPRRATLENVERRKAPIRTRAARLSIRLSDDQKSAILRAAAAAGQTPTDYILGALSSRPRLRERKIGWHVAFRQDLLQLAAPKAELNRVGNNLNQITRQIHRGHELSQLAESLASVLADVRAAQDRLDQVVDQLADRLSS